MELNRSIYRFHKRETENVLAEKQSDRTRGVGKSVHFYWGRDMDFDNGPTLTGGSERARFVTKQFEEDETLM